MPTSTPTIVVSVDSTQILEAHFAEGSGSSENDEDTNPDLVGGDPTQAPAKNLSTFSEWVETRKREERLEKIGNATNGHASQVLGDGKNGKDTERNGTLSKNGTQHPNGGTGATQSSQGSVPPPQPVVRKFKRNYASPDCGAKVVAHNAEAQNTAFLLTPSRDEYLLTPCKTEKRIYFVVELCEAIRPDRIELANFELFSSSPKEFTVSLGERFPTREWTLLGNFTADDQRGSQEFSFTPPTPPEGEPSAGAFGKFLKLEVLSHYGTEHYCPVSLLKVFGVSEYEAMSEEDAVSAGISSGDNTAEYALDEEEVGSVDREPGQGIFNSAKDKVIQMVKQAAEALVRPKETSSTTEMPSPGVPKNVWDSSDIPSEACLCPLSKDEEPSSLWKVLSCRWKELEFPIGCCYTLPDTASTYVTFCPSNDSSRLISTMLPPLKLETMGYLQTKFGHSKPIVPQSPVDTKPPVKSKNDGKVSRDAPKTIQEEKSVSNKTKLKSPVKKSKSTGKEDQSLSPSASKEEKPRKEQKPEVSFKTPAALE